MGEHASMLNLAPTPSTTFAHLDTRALLFCKILNRKDIHNIMLLHIQMPALENNSIRAKSLSLNIFFFMCFKYLCSAFFEKQPDFEFF